MKRHDFAPKKGFNLFCRPAFRAEGYTEEGFNMNFEDPEIKAELDKIDSKDILGIISLMSTIINIAYSIKFNLYTFDELISISFIFSVLSILHNKSKYGAFSFILLIIHHTIIAIIRFLG